MIKMMNEKEIRNEFINCIEGSHTLNLAISVLEDRERLQNNWNELKKWLEDEVKNLDKENPMGHDTTLTAYEGAYDNVLDKMQELEGNNDK